MLFDKNQKNLLLLVSLIMALVAFNGCSSDDDPTTPSGGGGGSGNAPEFTLPGTAAVDLPDALESSSDGNAQALVAVMSQVNTLSVLSAIMQVPEGAIQSKNKDGSWQYTWTINDSPVAMTFTLTIVETANSYTWSLRLNGFDGEFTYDNDLIYFAELAMDDSFGVFHFYDIEGEANDVVFSWEWSTDSAGVFTMTMIFGDDEEDAKTVFVVNPDGSGTLDIFAMADMSWQLVLHYEWDALGNGSWIVYEDGEVAASGNWVIGNDR